MDNLNIIDRFNKIDSPIKLLEFMDKYIIYGYKGKDNKLYIDYNSKEFNDYFHDNCIVQDYIGVLNTNIGTCWDQVELEREWFINHH